MTLQRTVFELGSLAPVLEQAQNLGGDHIYLEGIMFITTEIVKSETGRGRCKFKKIPHMMCDFCGKLYTEKVFKTARVTRELHFCSRTCTNESRKPGGRLHIQWTSNNTKLYGSTYNFIGDKRKNADYSNASQKRHETMKRNQTFQSSIPEEIVAQLLFNTYGVDGVDRQVRVINTRWEIDFYVRSLNRYVQVDGVYWHGLDRSLAMIQSSALTSKRDANILRKFNTDRAQDIYFGDKLLRITDVVARQLTQEKLVMMLENTFIKKIT